MSLRPGAGLCLLVVAAGCTGQVVGTDRDPGMAVDAVCFDDVGSTREALTIDEAISSGCSTSIVRGLSEQLIAELECLEPGRMGRIDHISGLSLGGAVFPWLQRPAATSLESVMAGGGTMQINSGLRTLPQQFLLYRWYQTGRCGIGLAAAPGRSNHNGGLAIDVSDYGSWRSRLESNGWRWLGSSDPVHFDYVGAGTADIRANSVLAFQRLWNRNHPEDRIAEDGVYGPQTEGRLSRSPSEGFPIGADCGVTEPDPDPPTPDPGPEPEPEPEPMPEPDPEPSTSPTIGITWAVDGDLYTFFATPPEGTADVRWIIDGVVMASVGRDDEGLWTLVAGRCADGETHEVVAIARDPVGSELASATEYFVAE